MCWIFIWRSGTRKEQVIIFGYNDEVKAILEMDDAEQKKYCIQIVSSEVLTLEEKYMLSRKGIHYHDINLMQVKQKELVYLLDKINVNKAKHIILFEDDSIRNYSLLQMFRLTDHIGLYKLLPDAKITCRCEDDDTADMISEYFDKAGNNSTKRYYDLELVSIPALQIRNMFETVPLHTFYLNKGKKLSDWNTHMLIAGFGSVGQQVVLQTMNLAVVSPDNNIVIDVFDQEINKKAGIFATHFSDKTFDITDDAIIMRSDAADGHFEIRFFKTDVRSHQFSKLIRQKHSESNYTYAVVTIDQISVSIGCANRIGRIFDEQEYSGIPIVIRMDTDRRLADEIQQGHNRYLIPKNDTEKDAEKNKTFLRRLQLLTERSEAVTLKNIINKELNRNARKIHDNYSSIMFEKEKYDPIPWDTLTVFKRESNQASAAFDPLWDDILKQRVSDDGSFSDISDCLNSFFSQGKGIWMEGETWHYESEEMLLKKLEQNKVLLCMVKTEHRRWCYFIASKGWYTGDRKKFKAHPCLVPYKVLEQKPDTRSTIKYDLLPMMRRVKQLTDQKS